MPDVEYHDFIHKINFVTKHNTQFLCCHLVKFFVLCFKKNQLILQLNRSKFFRLEV